MPSAYQRKKREERKSGVRFAEPDTEPTIAAVSEPVDSSPLPFHVLDYRTDELGIEIRRMRREAATAGLYPLELQWKNLPRTRGIRDVDEKRMNANRNLVLQTLAKADQCVGYRAAACLIRKQGAPHDTTGWGEDRKQDDLHVTISHKGATEGTTHWWSHGYILKNDPSLTKIGRVTTDRNPIRDVEWKGGDGRNVLPERAWPHKHVNMAENVEAKEYGEWDGKNAKSWRAIVPYTYELHN